MANRGRCPECPYYLGDSNNSITCEDTIRRFNSIAEKMQWTNLYCEIPEKWKYCPYADALEKLYETIYSRGFKGDPEKELLKYRVNAQYEEIKKLLQTIGILERQNSAQIEDSRYTQVTLMDLMEGEDE